MSKQNKGPTTHGLSGTPEHRAWVNLRSRCTNPNVENYPRYGGRGITVCTRWDSFENFLADMGKRPSPEHSIDRIDGDGNYEPGNCRWATNEEQQNNLSTNRWLTYNGERKTLTQWAKIIGITPEALADRIKSGDEGEVLFRPKDRGGRKLVECLALHLETRQVYIFQSIKQLCLELGDQIQRNHRTISRQLKQNAKYEDENFVVVHNNLGGKDIIDSFL